MNKIRNVLMISIDALRYDRLGIAGHRPAVTPNIDRLAKNGINCTNAFSHGFPSLFALPAIASSTQTLDGGGYDRGIKSRPKAITEVFQEQGFKTATIVTAPWQNGYFFYDRGVDDLIETYDIQFFWRSLCKSHFVYYKKYLDSNRITKAQFIDAMYPLLSSIFEHLIKSCDKFEKDRQRLPYYFVIFRHNFPLIKKRFQKELDKVNVNPEQYIFSHLERLVEGNICKYLDIPELIWKQRFLNSRFVEIANKFLIPLTGSRFIKNVGVCNGNYVTKVTQQWLKKHYQQPFFAWVHYFDVHDYYFGPRHFTSIIPHIKTIISRLLLGKKYRGFLPYDIALKYNDRLVGKLLQTLKQLDIADETLVVLFSDHGHPEGQPVHKPKNGKVTGRFYDELLHVPLIFSHPSLQPQTKNDLVGLIDLGPALVDLCKLPPQYEFKGISILSDKLAQRNYIIAEHLYLGPGNFSTNSIHMAIRERNYKLIWREANDGHNLPMRELYDLQSDPEEQKNRAGDPSLYAVEERLCRIAENRCAKLRATNGPLLTSQQANSTTTSSSKE